MSTKVAAATTATTIIKPAVMSASARAGLVFPVARVGRVLRARCTARRVSPGASVALAAILEYMSGEIIELAAKSAADNKHTRITPRDIKLAIDTDDELSVVFRQATIPGAGIRPHGVPATAAKKISKAKVVAARV